jgi:hypothetical protein
MPASVELMRIPVFIRVILRFGQLVGLCVLLTAATVLTNIVTYIVDGVRMQSWTPVEATIETAEYRHVEGNAGPQVFATYRYEYDGAEYHGTRVDVLEGLELVGDFQERMAHELQGHIADSSPATAYVNPFEPQESVLYPRFYWTPLAVLLGLCLALTLFGGSFFWLLGYALRRYKRLERRSAVRPGEPWLWRADWAEQRIHSTSHYDGWIFIGLGMFYLLVVLPVGLLVLVEWEREITSAPGIVLLVLGFMMFNMMRYGMKKRRLFGGAEFRLSTPTGVIGGALAGVVTIPHKLRMDKPCRVSLECVKRVRRGRGGVDEAIEWRTTTLLEQTLAADDPQTTTVPVYAMIDYDCEPWNWSEGRSWRLKVGPDVEGFPDFAQFEVPVFRTADSSPDFVPDPTILEPYRAKVDAVRTLGPMCRIEPLPDGGEHLRFSYFDRRVFFVALVAMTIIAVGIGALFHFEFHFVWTVIPVAFFLVMLFGVVQMLRWGSQVEIRRDEVTVVAGYWPFRNRHVFSRTDVGQRVRVEAHKELLMETRDWYGVQLRIEPPREPKLADDDGHTPESDRVEHLTIVRRLNNRDEVDVVRDWLEAKIVGANQTVTSFRTPSREVTANSAESQ